MKVAALAALMCAAAPQALAQASTPPAAPVTTEQNQTPRPETTTAQSASEQASPRPRAPSDGEPQAQEQTAPAQGVVVYRPDFFAESRPNNAYEMVLRVPGFVFFGGESARGFAGTAGNVLIDGKRPASKSDSLSDVLSRIQVNQVERVELIRGGAPGIDMQGRGVVVNVVRKAADSFQQTVSASTHWFLQSGKLMPGFRYEASRTRGDTAWDFAAGVGINMNDSVGNGTRIRRNAAGTVIRSEEAGTEGDGLYPNARGSFKRPLLGGEFRANGAVGVSTFKDESHFYSPATGRIASIGRDSSRSAEIGANYERNVTERLSLETVVLQKLAQSEFQATSEQGGGRDVFTSEAESGETIGRGVLRWRQSDTLSFEAGGEAALNFREGHVAFTDDGVPADLPAADVRVEERRGELFAQMTWRPWTTLGVEAGSRFEFSTISVEDLGGSEPQLNREKSLYYPKPRLQLSWTPSKNDTYRLRLEREVGQLNFGDFVSSANLTEGRVAAGNPDIEPAKSWVIEATAERRFWNTGAVSLMLRHKEITDVVDRLPVFVDADGDGVFERVFDAPGNIGDGRNDEVEFNLTLPLARFGIAGGEFKAELTRRESEVTDPTTLRTRRISGQRPEVIELEYRHDLPRWKATYGALYFNGWREEYYRFNEIATFEIVTPFTQVWLEYKPTPQLSWRFEFSNINRFDFVRTREVYDGPRNTAPLLFTEEFQTQSQQRAFIRLRRVFGG